MQPTVRTTIRIRKDLFEQSRILAFKKGTSLQDIINEGLAVGYKHITDIHGTKKHMNQIDSFRDQLGGKDINIAEVIEVNKTQQR